MSSKTASKEKQNGLDLLEEAAREGEISADEYFRALNNIEALELEAAKSR